MNIQVMTMEKHFEQAREDIELIKNKVLPMLKGKNTYDMADIELISTVFFNVGSRMNTFQKLAEIRKCDSETFKIKRKAEKMYGEYFPLIEEMFEMMEQYGKIESIRQKMLEKIDFIQAHIDLLPLTYEKDLSVAEEYFQTLNIKMVNEDKKEHGMFLSAIDLLTEMFDIVEKNSLKLDEIFNND